MALPSIIQGGMGVAVSNWRLARAVSRAGQLGVVSGTLMAVVLARRLEQGDPGGEMRRALAAFPFTSITQSILSAHFIANGRAPATPYRAVAMPSLTSAKSLTELIVAANFVEVFLAKEGHDGIVGINLLEKVQVATLPSLYGAMLAGVDYVLMGAGIPRAIPQVLDHFARGEPAQLKLDVEGARPTDDFTLRFCPSDFAGGSPPTLRRPQFLAIVSSATLALTLARKSSGRVDGFVVEGPVAGGHNAPPRGEARLSSEGEPVYGPRDEVDLGKIRELGLPFWLAGSYASPAKLAEAQAVGAAGIQIGTAFAFCEEAGIESGLKDQVIASSRAGELGVFTDPLASPTGFPFKVVQVPGTLSQAELYATRKRVCDLGYLRQPYRREDGTVGYRCPSEPVEDFCRKGGAEEATTGRMCLCNGLAAAAGFAQCREDGPEQSVVTAGVEVATVARMVPEGRAGYTAKDVLAAITPAPRTV